MVQHPNLAQIGNRSHLPVDRVGGRKLLRFACERTIGVEQQRPVALFLVHDRRVSELFNEAFLALSAKLVLRPWYKAGIARWGITAKYTHMLA
jgi:hypothetical protein